jgi:site-specific recombinase XerD
MRFDVLFNLFTKSERKRLTLRTDGPVDYYTENDPYELKKFFAACNDEERLRFMFFLHTGAREKEVSYAGFRDLDLTNRTFRIDEKTYDGKAVRIKNRKGRTVPIPQILAVALTRWQDMPDTRFSLLDGPRPKNGDRQLIFTNGNGGPEGHFLYQLKQIALRAGLNCGNCVTGSYDDFFNIISGTEQSCKDSACCEQWTLHKFRRTWATFHLWNGVPITTLQAWIGHSDLTTLNRYVAHINASLYRPIHIEHESWSLTSLSLLGTLRRISLTDYERNFGIGVEVPLVNKKQMKLELEIAIATAYARIHTPCSGSPCGDGPVSPGRGCVQFQQGECCRR